MPEDAKGALGVVIQIIFWIVMVIAALAIIGYFSELFFGKNILDFFKGF